MAANKRINNKHLSFSFHYAWSLYANRERFCQKTTTWKHLYTSVSNLPPGTDFFRCDPLYRMEYDFNFHDSGPHGLQAVPHPQAHLHLRCKWQETGEEKEHRGTLGKPLHKASFFFQDPHISFTNLQIILQSVPVALSASNASQSKFSICKKGTQSGPSDFTGQKTQTGFYYYSWCSLFPSSGGNQNNLGTDLHVKGAKKRAQIHLKDQGLQAFLTFFSYFQVRFEETLPTIDWTRYCLLSPHRPYSQLDFICHQRLPALRAVLICNNHNGKRPFNGFLLKFCRNLLWFMGPSVALFNPAIVSNILLEETWRLFMDIYNQSMRQCSSCP